MAYRGKNVGLCASVAAFCAIAGASCSEPPKGSLILAISTDMQAPQDISVVSVFVSNNGVPKFDYLGAVTPDGTVTLPATLALVESENPDDEIRIRVTGFQAQKARVLRDVITKVPHQHTSLLRLPLNFLDDGSAIGTLPLSQVPGSQGMAPEGDSTFDALTIRSSCGATTAQTSFAGTCIDSHVDSSKLPGWSDTEVYGEGGTASTPNCFDVTRCFGKAKPITNVDMSSCSFPLPAGANGSHWNCALATTDGTGACAGSLCLVPLETDPNEGFTVMNGNTIQMVPGVCAKIKAGATLYADNTTLCPQKIEGAPVCQPAEAIDAGAPASDGGSSGPTDATVGGEGGVMGSDGAVASDDGGAADAGASPEGGGCVPPGGPTGGLADGTQCAAADAGPDSGIPACGGSCSSHSCAADPATGVPLCQPSSGCRVTGEECTADGDCCGGGSDAGGATCVSVNACGVGVCQSAATSCMPNGFVCHTAVSGCNTPSNCCSGTLAPSCVSDNMHVPRCAVTTCLPAGSACATSADCCTVVGAGPPIPTPCVPSSVDAGLGSLTCYPAGCVPLAGPCTTNADCCTGLACTGGACVTHP